MNETSSGWQTNIYGILPHPTEPRILMRLEETGWVLPHVHLNEAVWEAGRMSQALERELGIPTTGLRCASNCEDEVKHRIDAVCVLETHGPIPEPLWSGQWVGRDQVANLRLALPEHRAVIGACLAEAESGVIPPCRAPWALPGWYAEAASWIQAQLAQLGYTLTGPIEQVKSWCLACVLRAHTTTGDVYLKVAAASPLFINEPALMQGLARLYPDHVPAPLCIDRERRWMLLADFGSELGWGAPVEVREEVLGVFGRLQIESAQRVDELLAMGCMDRRLNVLANQIDPLLNDADVLSGLPEAEMAQLRALAPRLKAMCATLASYNVPPALVHGDMHMSNVARRNGNYLFFDWTDTCIAHPFLDMIDILHEKAAAVQTRLRDRYLALWTDFEPMDRLLEMWALAYPLCALHQAVSYRYIIANVETTAKQDFDRDMPFWLGKILKSLQ